MSDQFPESGYSFIELNIVCAISVVLIALGTPQFLSAVDRIALATEVRSVKSAILRAQALSYADQRDRSLVLSKSTDGFSYSVEDDVLPHSHKTNGRVSVSGAPKTTYRVRDDQIKILFKPSGWITGGTLTIQNRLGVESQLVVQAVIGRVVIR